MSKGHTLGSYMAQKVPRLGKSRNGVFYVRSLWRDSTGKRHLRQQSLGTKDPLLAQAIALRFCLTLTEAKAMKKTGGIADLLSLHTNPLKITTATGEVVDFDPSNPAEAAYADKVLSRPCKIHLAFWATQTAWPKIGFLPVVSPSSQSLTRTIHAGP
jgi:hypothetical protein